MHALHTFLAALVLGLATHVVSLEEVCGREVGTVGQCKQENSQVCYDGDGSISSRENCRSHVHVCGQRVAREICSRPRRRLTSCCQVPHLDEQRARCDLDMYHESPCLCAEPLCANVSL